MFSKTKSTVLDEVQTPYYFVNKRHYGEDVNFYLIRYMGDMHHNCAVRIINQNQK